MGYSRSISNEEDLVSSAPLTGSSSKTPEDSYNLVYIIHFILGAGYLLPWNAFITAVDYFDYLYPNTSVDRIFSVVYMLITMLILLIILPISHKSTAFIRINTGLLFFLMSLVIPITDVVHTKLGFSLTVSAVGLSGVADALVQGSLIGSAGELPERYMQATIVGTAASGFLVSILRVLTKAAYPPDPDGLRKSANLYFSVSIVFMGLCVVCYNVSHNLPVIKYYRDLKMRAVSDDSGLHGFSMRSKNLWVVVRKVKWYGLGLFLIYVVTLSIFPGYITEDVHSASLGDWYSIILITGYNVFDLVGKCLSAVYVPESSFTAVVASGARFLFYPLFFGCLHGPELFRSEIPVTLLTCLLGLSNGYLTSVLMIMAPKVVELQHSEVAGIVMVLFLVIGLAVGSIVGWFWVI